MELRGTDPDLGTYLCDLNFSVPQFAKMIVSQMRERVPELTFGRKGIVIAPLP